MTATASAHRARARKRAACAAAGHRSDRVRVVEGREWCTLCRWWVGTPLITGRSPVELLAEAVTVDA